MKKGTVVGAFETSSGFGDSSIDYVNVLPAICRRRAMRKLRIASHFVIDAAARWRTAMAACAALGLRASYLGPLGNDDNGQRILAELRAEGVDVSRAIVREAASRYAVILVDKRTGDRCRDLGPRPAVARRRGGDA